LSNPSTTRPHVLEVGFVWPPETFLRLQAEALAARGFRVTVAAVVPRDEPRPRVDGMEVVCLADWTESPAWMLLGVLADTIGLAARSPASLRGALAAAWSANLPAIPGRHPRTVASLPADAGPRQRWARRLMATLVRLRSYLPLAHLRPDVVHFAWNSAAIGYLPLARVWGCPTVVSCHGSEVNVRPHVADGTHFAPRLRSSFQRVSAVHCVSQAIACEAVGHGMDPDRAWLIRSGVSSRFFHRRRQAAPAGRELRIVSIGVLRWLKGHEYALRTLDRLLKQGVPARLDVLGEEPGRPCGELSERMRIEHTIGQLGLSDRVHLHGHVAPTEVRRRLHAADVLLHTSLSEGIPTAMLEAMACGLPVVVTDCGGVREAVDDGVEGFVVPLRDPARAADALRGLHQDPGLRRRMGAAGRAVVESRFSVSGQIDAFAHLYEAMVAGRADRASVGAGIAVPRPGRSAPALSAGALRLLSVGPLSWTQGLEDAIHVVGLLGERGIGAHLRIVGEGEHRDPLCFARHQLGLQRQVEIRAPGTVDCREQMDWADALLDVSVTDSPQRALAQARANDLPAFTTAAGEGAETVHQVPSRDPAAVADAIAAQLRTASLPSRACSTTLVARWAGTSS
jgi:glycosyltransferase involved in cell wall biosynthesis